MNTVNLITGSRYTDTKNNYSNLVCGDVFDKLDYKCDCCGKNLINNNSYEFATFANNKILDDLLNVDGTINFDLWTMASGYYHYGCECLRKKIAQADNKNS